MPDWKRGGVQRVNVDLPYEAYVKIADAASEAAVGVSTFCRIWLLEHLHGACAERMASRQLELFGQLQKASNENPPPVEEKDRHENDDGP